MANEAVKVLYIMGWARSGSTLLGNILGELEGFIHVGELRSIWRQVRRASHCGCGVLVPDCQLWRRVFEVAFDGNPSTLELIAHWRREEIRPRNLLRLLASKRGGLSGQSSFDKVVEATDRLYRTIAEVTGSRVIIDTSKRIPDAAFARLLPGVSTFFVLLVRDPRATAFSWRRHRLNPNDPRGTMLQYTPAVSTRNWIGSNLVGEWLIRKHGRQRGMVVRYEDFTRAPRQTVESIIALLGEKSLSLPFEDETTVRLNPNHTVGGNPNRFHSGPVRIRDDDEWLANQRKVDRWISTVIALPLLGRYRYPLRPSGRSKNLAEESAD